MRKLSINDWQTMHSRKEIEELRKEQKRSYKFNIAILCDLLLVIVGFALESILGNDLEVFNSDSGALLYIINRSNQVMWVWVIILIILFIVLFVLLLYPFFKERKYRLRKNLKSGKDIVDLFDNKLNFYIMSAEAIDLNGISLKDSDYVNWYYYIEKSYYINKCVMLLDSMKSSLKNAIEGNDYSDTISGCKITKARFYNTIKLIESQYMLLSQIEKNYKNSMNDEEKEKDVTKFMNEIFDENATYYSMLCSVFKDNECFFHKNSFPKLINDEIPYDANQTII